MILFGLKYGLPTRKVLFERLCGEVSKKDTVRRMKPLKMEGLRRGSEEDPAEHYRHAAGTLNWIRFFQEESVIWRGDFS
jgi:hypothetical protein